MTSATATSANFGFLGQHDAQLVRLGALAERYFRDDPNTSLIKLRQFGEVLAQLVAATESFLSPCAREEQCLPADPARSALARSLRTSNL